MTKPRLWYLYILLIPGLIIGNDPIDKAISKNLSTIVELRHQIHQYPELGNREFKTAELVAEHLRSLGIEVETGVAYTGVVGILKGNKPGPVVAVRADMDALPVTEETDLSFKSTVKTTYLDKEVGVMHACGHDIHTSVQLGVASVLASMKRSLPGTVKFIFQPAEEGPPPREEGGADLMLKEGVFDNLKPSAIFGLHTHPGLAVGELGLTIGPAMAAVDQFIITIKGKQSHGAYPHKSVDPIIMATEVVDAFQTIRSRSLSPWRQGPTWPTRCHRRVPGGGWTGTSASWRAGNRRRTSRRVKINSSKGYRGTGRERRCYHAGRDFVTIPFNLRRSNDGIRNQRQLPASGRSRFRTPS